MRKHWKGYAAVCLAGGLTMTQLAGCGNRDMKEITDEAGNVAETDADGGITVTAQLGEDRTQTVRYLPEDLDAEWDVENVTGIVLADSGVIVEGSGARENGTAVVIEKAGTYVVSGQMENGQIRIETDDDAVVRLVLNGVQLSNKTTAPVYSQEKNKVILTLASGTVNVISDGSDYQYETEGEDEPDAPIFTKGDLTINGTGELQVHGNYQSGIRSKGNLTVVSGAISIDAQDDGLKGKDAVVIRDGVLDIKSVKDGIKSNNDTDEEKGFIWIDGGSIAIAAQDDGIQAETALIVNGGEITISESQEGLAGKTVDILGGLIKANASDDGINSAAAVETEQEKQQDQEGVYTRIAGGEIWLNASADGIDSNGDLLIEGGSLYLTGPASDADGILDYNGFGTITGGTVFAAGSAGMMQTFGDESTQNYLVVYYSESQKAGTDIRLLDGSGKELGSFSPEKEYQAVIISSPEIRAGETYHVQTGEDTVEMAVSGIVTISGTAPDRGAGEGRRPEGREGFGEGGNMKRPEGETLPEGAEKPDRANLPEGAEKPDRANLPEGTEKPEGRQEGKGRRMQSGETEPSEGAAPS